MSHGRCAAHCGCGINRRRFLAGSAASVAGLTLLAGCEQSAQMASIEKIAPCGPASTHRPRIQAAFVRRQEDYGMWWPGAVYDGEAARERYTQDVRATAEELSPQ